MGKTVGFVIVKCDRFPKLHGEKARRTLYLGSVSGEKDKLRRELVYSWYILYTKFKICLCDNSVKGILRSDDFLMITSRIHEEDRKMNCQF